MISQTNSVDSSPILPTDQLYQYERQVQILSKSDEKYGQNWILNISFGHNPGSIENFIQARGKENLHFQ